MEVWKTIKQDAEEFGANITNATFDWKTVMERKDQYIDKFVSGKKPQLEKLGVDFIEGEAVFTSPHTIRVGDKEYSADRFLIGTGSKPALPPVDGIEHALTSRDLLNVKELPESLVIIGGGVIGLEFAHIYANAGVKVTILQRGNYLLKGEDQETSDVIQEITENRGITVIKKADVKKVKETSGGYHVHYNVGQESKEVHGEKVAAATGRKPDVENLGLEAAGVHYTKKGIKVNDYLQTTSENIYAAGDSIGGLMITPVAAFESRLAVRNAFHGNKETVDYSIIPHAIFTLPSVASVGFTEEEATDKGIDYQVNKTSFSKNGTALLIGKTEGYTKILSEKDSGRIIGVHIVGAYADEIIYEMAIAMKANCTVHHLSKVTQVHPTISETWFGLANEAAADSD